MIIIIPKTHLFPVIFYKQESLGKLKIYIHIHGTSWYNSDWIWPTFFQLLLYNLWSFSYLCNKLEMEPTDSALIKIDPWATLVSTPQCDIKVVLDFMLNLNSAHLISLQRHLYLRWQRDDSSVSITEGPFGPLPCCDGPICFTGGRARLIMHN